MPCSQIEAFSVGFLLFLRLWKTALIVFLAREMWHWTKARMPTVMKQVLEVGVRVLSGLPCSHQLEVNRNLHQFGNTDVLTFWDVSHLVHIWKCKQESLDYFFMLRNDRMLWFKRHEGSFRTEASPGDEGGLFSPLTRSSLLPCPLHALAFVST